MPKKNDTPVAVRVARWTAVAAAITGLCTIGNTFIEKRPWFLGGEDEKPAIVASVPKQELKKEYYEPPAPIRFSMNPPAPPESVARSSRTAEASVMSSASALERFDTSGETQMAMNGVPNMGPWINFLNFVEYRPIPAWTIIGSVFLISIFSIVEFFYRRKKKKDHTKWTMENPDYSVGPDIQKPLP